MSELETRTIALTETQWRHLEALIKDHIEVGQHKALELVNLGDAKAFEKFSADFDFYEELLTALRSEGE